MGTQHFFFPIRLLARLIHTRYKTDLNALILWMQGGERAQEIKLLTREGRELAQQFYQKLQENEQLLYKLQQASLVDELTGLLNRRGMRNRLVAEHNRVQRQEEGGSYALLLFDVDNFKAVNDSFGHAAGDLVLRQLALLVQNELRCSDDCARWGGEEFLVLLPDTSFADAYWVAEKLLHRVASGRFYLAEAVINITVTIGIAVGGGRFSIEEMVNQADLCLYRGKKCGRNCIVPYPKLPHVLFPLGGEMEPN